MWAIEKLKTKLGVQPIEVLDYVLYNCIRIDQKLEYAHTYVYSFVH